MENILKRKEELNAALLGLKDNLNEQNFNDVQQSVGSFFAEFENSLCEKTNKDFFASKVGKEDYLTSIENVFDFAIHYKMMMDLLSKKLNVNFRLQSNFLRTSESVLNRYRKKRAREFKINFEKVGLPTTGFANKIALRTSKIDWVSIIAGVVCIGIASLIAFFSGVSSGYQNLIFRLFFASGAACFLSGTCKGFIEVHVKTNRFALTAIGGFAIFVLTYLVNPPSPPEFETPSKQNEIQTERNK